MSPGTSAPASFFPNVRRFPSRLFLPECDSSCNAFPYAAENTRPPLVSGQQLSGDVRGSFLVAWFELAIEHQLAQLVFYVTDPAARRAVEEPHQLVAIQRALPL